MADQVNSLLTTSKDEEKERDIVQEDEFSTRLDSLVNEIDTNMDQEEEDELDVRKSVWDVKQLSIQNIHPAFNDQYMGRGSPSEGTLATPGIGGSFMQGMTFGREDLFGVWGNSLEPSTTGEKVSGFGGSMVPLIAGFLAVRYPFGVAMAQAELTGMLGRIMAEMGASLVTDVAYETFDDSPSIKNGMAVAALGVVASALLPGNIPINPKILAKRTIEDVIPKTGQVAEDVVASEVAKQIAKTESYTGLVPNIFKESQFTTDIAKSSVKKHTTHGETVVQMFNDLTSAWKNRYDDESARLVGKLDEFPERYADPDDMLGEGVRVLDNEVDDFLSKTGGLTGAELDKVGKQIDELADRYTYFDPELVKEDLRVKNQKLWKGGTPPEQYTSRVVRNYEKGGVDLNDEYISRHVDLMSDRLDSAGNNLSARLRPYTTDVDGPGGSVANRYKQAIEETEKKLSQLGDTDKELVAIRKDLDKVVSAMKDSSIEFAVPPGFSGSSMFRSFIQNMTTAAEIYKHRPDILEQQLRVLADVGKDADVAVQREAQAAINQVSRYKAHAEEKQIDDILDTIFNTTETPKIETLDMYNKAKEGVKEQLKLRPQYEQATKLQFDGSPEAREALSQLDVQLEGDAQRLLGGPWEEVKPEIDQLLKDPNKLGANIVRTRAVLGDPGAQDYINFQNTQKGNIVFHDPMTGAHADPTAGVVASKKSKKSGKSIEDVERVILDDVDVQARSLDVADARKDIGDNLLARNFGELKTNMGVYIRKLEKQGDLDGAKILKKVIHEMESLTYDQREFMGKIADLNDVRNSIYREWQQKGIAEQMFEEIDTVSEMANKIIREAPDNTTGRNKATEAINEWLMKQSDDVRNGYTKYRDLEDDKYRRIVDHVRYMNDKYGLNIDEPGYRPGYVHFVYDGDWVFKVKGKDGTWSIPYGTRAEVANALNELVEQGRNLDDTVFSIEPRWADDLDDFSIADGALKDGSAFGISHRDLKAMYETTGKFKSDNVVDVVFGALRGRTMGLEGRKKAVRDSIAISDRLTERYITMLEPTIKMQQSVTTLDKAGFKTLSQDVKLWTNDALGRSRDIENAVDKHLRYIHKVIDAVPGARKTADSLGLRSGGRPLRTGVNMLASTGRMLSIGFNPMTALIQLTQGMTNVGPIAGFGNFFRGWHHLKDFTKPGRWHNLATRANIQIRSVDGGLGKLRGNTSSGWGEGLQRNISKPRMNQSTLEYTLDQVEHFSMVPFNAAENRQRMASLWALVKDAENMAKRIKAGSPGRRSKYKVLNELSEVMGKPVDSQEVIDAYALRMLDKLQFDFSTTGIAAAARSPLFKLPLQFKTYFFQEIEFLMGRKLPLSHTERFKSLAVFLGLGGIAGLPFAEDVDYLATKVFGKSPMLWMYANAPDVVTAGFPSIANISLSPLIQAGGMRSMSILPGFGGVLSSKLNRAMEEYKQGKTDMIGAILGTNTMARNFIEAADMVKYGAVYAPGGTTPLREGGLGTAFGEALGVQTMENTKRHKFENVRYQASKAYNSQRRADRQTIVTAYADGDNPYVVGKELGYDRDTIKQWIKQRRTRKVGESTGIPKAVQEEFKDYENMLYGR